VIRLAAPADAPALLALQHRLDAQSTSMLLQPGERETMPHRLAARLGGQDGRGAFDLVAVEDGSIGNVVGWAEVSVLPWARARHLGTLVLGVDAAAAGRGLGRALLEEAAAEGTRRGLTRLELTVLVDNLRAVRLYLRAGFTVEGLRRGSVRRDGVVTDEYWMARLLG
jgi:ribosomal protein S18 acetylase RimI-like enzyme